MKNYLFFTIVIFFLAACNSNTSNQSNDNGPEGLANKYKTLSLPFNAIDSTMEDIASDTAVSLQDFTKYFSDTIFNAAFGRDRKLKLYPVGKIQQGDNESYYLTLAKGDRKSVV